MINGWRKTEYNHTIWVRDGKYMWPCVDSEKAIRSTGLRWPTTKAGEYEKTRGVLFLPEEYLM